MPRSPMHSKNLISAKALFFTTAMCGVGWSRFQNNFYLDNGLSSTEIGTLKSVGLLLKIAGEPFWSMIADLTDQKIVFGMCMIMQILTMEILRVSKPLTYNMIFIVKVLRTTTAPSATLTTTASFKLTEGTNEGYGQQRMFGSLAWGGGAFIAGYLIDTYGMNALFYYTYFFNITSFLFVVFGLPSTRHMAHNAIHNIVVVKATDDDEIGVDDEDSSEASALQSPTDVMDLRSRSRSADRAVENNPLEQHVPTSDHSRSFRHYVKELYLFFSHAPCRVILMNSFLYGVVMTVPDTFLFVSLEQDFKASRTYSGLVTSTSILACLPLFWFSGSLIAKYGHFKLIFVSQCSCIARLMMYGLLSPGWSMSLYVLPAIQVLHGLNFAVYWAAAIDAIYKLAPKELQTISIAALNVSYYTFGGAVGNLVWGYAYDHFNGAEGVYRYSCVLLVVTVLLFRSRSHVLNSASLSHVSNLTSK